MFCDGQMFLIRCSVSKMHSWLGFITLLRTINVLLYFAYLISFQLENRHVSVCRKLIHFMFLRIL